MITFEVTDMTCGHCVSTITKAVRAVDQGARVTADLGTRVVRIEPAESDSKALADAIREAGYTPVQVAVAVEATPAKEPAARSGCCCR